MRTALVHLSDIHLRSSGSPIIQAIDQLVSAVNSVDASISLFLVIISGDIANTGVSTEYQTALRFFRDFENKLRGLRPDAAIKFVSVPGNHDCVLPKSKGQLRKTLVQGVIPSMQELKQDEASIGEVAKVQAHYNRFRKQLQDGRSWNGICEKLIIEHRGQIIQVNLYNTALLSQNPEQQGQLHVPVKIFEQHITIDNPSALSISVFHHSYLWLESNVGVSFRRHIERTSDIALMGHQHHSHEFYKHNSTGEQVLYIEAPALQDENYPKASSFRVLVVDRDSQQEKLVTFRRSKDIYARTEETDWRPLTLNKIVRTDFRLNPKFENYLNNCGIPLFHPVKGALQLRDIFVFPNLTVRSAGAKIDKGLREVRGEDILTFVSKSRRIIFQGSGMGGKTSLAKMLFWEIQRRGKETPLLLNGILIKTAAETKTVSDFWRAFRDQYSDEMLEHFRQLPSSERVLIIDDWHRSDLNPDGRKAFLATASKYFGTLLLLTDDLFQIHELIGKSTDTMLEFDQAYIPEFGNALRGKIIDKWVMHGREHTAPELVVNREIEEKERLIKSMIGKNTLPSLPFIVLALLEAESDKSDAPEAGSFGYLYEVLITGALNTSGGPKAQLEKKYKLLSIVAYRMFQLKTKSLPLSQLKEIAHEYAISHFINLDFDSLLADLEEARVLVNMEGNYAFAYSHLYFYFIARYYRDNLERQGGLRSEIDHMVDNVSSNEYAAILMFSVYFARHSDEIVKRLVSNANQIYKPEKPADLDKDVDFLNKLGDQSAPVLPDGEIDVAKARTERREFQDRMAQNLNSLPDRPQRAVVYSENLSDTDKFNLAYQHIELLGQVIRNFPASLPGHEKLEILKATYLLGLRLLTALLRLLRTTVEINREQMIEGLKAQAGKYGVTEEKLRKVVDILLLMVSRIATFSVIKRISMSVGVADLEEAYKEALKLVGSTNATQLIDTSIKLDHFVEFPLADIRDLHKQFDKNPFADTILADLVVSHIMVFDVNNRIRQHMATLFKFKANTPLLMDPTKKKN
jgi:UDP-2,3-diacylglucosamine pyrophosphatase LpxH